MQENTLVQPTEKFWNRERIVALGTAIITTIALPISIDQGYFRYNAYVLPCLGLFTVVLYVTFLLTIPPIKNYGREIFGINPKAGVIFGSLLLIILLGCLAEGFIFALNKSKEHVGEARRANSSSKSVPADAIQRAKSGGDAKLTSQAISIPKAVTAPVRQKPAKPSKQAAQESTGSPTLDTPPIAPPGSLMQSNSGGLNIQQGTTGSNSPIIDSPINVGSFPRAISAVDMPKYIDFFRSAKAKAKIRIGADQYSGAAPLPDDFYQALKDGGWDMADPGVSRFMAFSAPGKVFQGVIVTVRGEPLAQGEKISLSDTDPLIYIGSALEILKLPHLLQRSKTQPDGLISINFVGGFPTTP